MRAKLQVPAGWLALVAGALAAGLSGCDGLGPSSSPDGGSCINVQCGDGQICTADGRCVTLAMGSSSFGVEVVPKAGTGVPQEFTLSPGDGASVLQLARAAVLTGRVVLSSNREASIPATIIATRKSSIPGRPDVQTTVEAMGGVREGDGQPAFQLPLLQGVEHTIRIVPGSDVRNAPPLLLEGEQAVILAKNESFDFVIPDGDNAMRLQGQILDAAGVPFKGAIVTAHDPSTDELVSTQAVTARGSFVLHVRPGQKSVVLRVRQPEGMTGPTVDMGPIPLPRPPKGERPPAVLLDALQMPAQRGILPRATLVEGKAPDGTDQPVVGALVTFSAEYTDEIMLSGLTGLEPMSLGRRVRHQPVQMTDLAGSATVSLIQGAWKYDLVIVPPVGSPYRTYQENDIPVVEEGFGPTITLLPKPSLVGKVRSPSGQPVPNVVVEASPSLTGPAPYALAPWLNGTAASSTTSDSNGDFRLPLDPLPEGATYTLVLRPPDASGFPRTTVRGIAIDPVVEQQEVPGGEVRLASPGLLSGQVLAPDGSALTEATLRVYQLDERDGRPWAQLVGESTAQAGTFQVVVPAEP